MVNMRESEDAGRTPPASSAQCEKNNVEYTHKKLRLKGDFTLLGSNQELSNDESTPPSPFSSKHLTIGASRGQFY